MMFVVDFGKLVSVYLPAMWSPGTMAGMRTRQTYCIFSVLPFVRCWQLGVGTFAKLSLAQGHL